VHGRRSYCRKYVECSTREFVCYISSHQPERNSRVVRTTYMINMKYETLMMDHFIINTSTNSTNKHFFQLNIFTKTSVLLC
jgi:hypothetical protein